MENSKEIFQTSHMDVIFEDLKTIFDFYKS